MLKFNNTNILTGYIKQLLASFNLPKYRVYTTELAEQEAAYADLAEEKTAIQADIANIDNLPLTADAKIAILASLNKRLSAIEAQRPEIISTEYRNDPVTYSNKGVVDYPTRMRYVPYIKDGMIQEYVDGEWIKCHVAISSDQHRKVHSNDRGYYKEKQFVVDEPDLNYTKTLAIGGNSYDYHTHEYLGDFLRFFRDYYNFDLMSLYNCFSNNTCKTLKIEFTDQKIAFNTADSNYKIYMLPVKLFKDYTIAIDCETDVEMCCGLFGEYYTTDDRFTNLPLLTYQCFSNLNFNNPILYTKISDLHTTLSSSDETELAMYEDNLKLFIKLPATNTSTITILEGDYRNYRDSLYYPSSDSTWIKKANHAVLNFEYSDIVDSNIKLPTNLQLLMSNSGVSHPFADRLIEYLVGNVVSPLDKIADNVLRAQTVASYKYKQVNAQALALEHVSLPDAAKVETDSIWDNNLRLIFYNYMNNAKNTQIANANHDILGYVDKDVEKYYSYTSTDGTVTIAGIDIYDGKWED